MAKAIKQISLTRGYDVRRYALVTFGGAGGQHACAVADALGIDRVFIHRFAGVLSAYGMGLAELRVLKECSMQKSLSLSGLEEAGQIMADLETEARTELLAQGSAVGALIGKFYLRYQGTNTPLPVGPGTVEEMEKAFLKAHLARFGFVSDSKGRPLVIDSLSLEAIGPSDAPSHELRESGTVVESKPKPITNVEAVLEDRWQSIPLFERGAIGPESRIDGPAIIVESTTTTVVEAGWRAEMSLDMNLLLRRITRLEKITVGTTVDPIRLELFNNMFMSVAEQMGAVLQNSAYSVNIKERLDFSCAVFDAGGRLVANAPHVPVHLGSMGEAVRAIIRRRGAGVQPGQVFALNDPFAGGTHLPDVTVVTPVFGDSARPLFWVASRGHHADIGGLTPGSMPPQSRTIEEEGVLITDFLLVEGGVFREAEFVSLLTGGRYPARNPAQNVGDIRAQIAANEKGSQELYSLVDQFGLEVVEAYMAHVRANAAEEVRRVIPRLKPGRFIQRMDFGGEIHVGIDVDVGGRAAIVDFTGTSPQSSGNFNAPSSIVKAAVLYVFRTLVKEDIPLNDGCLEAIKIVIPPGSLLAPQAPAAVVAGNVETSQAVTNALYGALGVLASGQGTMNNLTFGNGRYQYYETICGGAGAGNGFGGASAVHTHMTNSRLTDPEVLELRFPVLIDLFQIKRGSGGLGRWSGGDGVVRQIRFREPMMVAILANNRVTAPFGLEGGGCGEVGKAYIRRSDGRTEDLGSSGQSDVQAGDSIVVETPGGGGFGVSP